MKRTVDFLVRAILVLALVYLGAAAVLRYVAYPADPRPDIAHGGGRARDGAVLTNSLDAITLSASAGFAAIEVDISRTSDGHFVCGHDWEAFGGQAPDLATFLARRHQAANPACTAEELIAWFEANPGPDLYVDVKQDAVAGSALFDGILGRRTIADAVSPEAVCALREAGVERVVFSTYARPLSWNGLRADLSNACVDRAEAIAIPMERAFLGHAYIARAVTGLPVYLHTVDGCLSTAAARFLGADGVFTDAARPDLC